MGWGFICPLLLALTLVSWLWDSHFRLRKRVAKLEEKIYGRTSDTLAEFIPEPDED